MATKDLAGRTTWDDIWRRESARTADLRSYYDARISALFDAHVATGSRVLEVGCGGSVWLPLLAHRKRCEVWGIDYSRRGVELARANLERAGASGTIVLGDALADNDVPMDHFDVLWSYGVVEHFDDVEAVVRRLAKHLRPGGLMITLVPNLAGAIGWLHRVVDPEIYAGHMRLLPEDLDRAHLDAGLAVEGAARYYGVFSIGVVNFNRFRKRLPTLVDRLFWAAVIGTQQAACLPFRVVGKHPETRTFSPWAVGVYRRCDS